MSYIAGLYREYLEIPLSAIALKDVTPGLIRAWHAELVAAELKPTMVAKAYRLLHAVLNTAVDDELIVRNPCRIRGAGESRTPERPVATIAQVLDVAASVPARFRALILLAAFTSLRYGELAALRPRDIDADAATVTVRLAMVELATGEIIFGPPKTNAGRRTVTVPAQIRKDLLIHLCQYTGGAPTALVFTGAKGAQPRRANFQRAARWATTVRAVGLPGFHFHELRHIGNALAATPARASPT